MRTAIAFTALALAACANPPTDPSTSTSSTSTSTSSTSTSTSTPTSTSTSPPAPSASSTPTAAADPAGSTTDPLVGQPAPDFTRKTFDGKEVHIAAMKGKPVVVYFYPKDETPGCTKEACSFRDAWKQLAATGVALVGVSMDDAESHRKFAEHHKLPFLLVTDDGTIAKAYGVPVQEGYTSRQTFVIGADGNVKKVYRKVNVAEHTAQVLADLKP
jgi:peroxiredoxin Q/BCP